MALDLYNELSNQDDPSKESVKLGNTSTVYLEDLYNRLISAIASLLKLREQYFKL